MTESKKTQVHLVESSMLPERRHGSSDSSEGNSFASLKSSNPPMATRRKFRSTRLVGPFEKPWLQDATYKEREKMEKVILLLCAGVGVGLAMIICGIQWKTVVKGDFCLILDDDFKIFNESTWTREVEVGGYGYGSFDWTTDDPQNSFISDDGLHIVPTLTLDSTNITVGQIQDGYTVNLTADGTCTTPLLAACEITSNSTNGTIINPVRSARLTTAGKVSIKYGKVEIVAKMPGGDWLLPMLWMYPENETYGVWPRSGEIDIAQIRGNDPAHYTGGRDTILSALHWGVWGYLDQSDRTTGQFTRRRYDLAKGFHTYGLEWTATKLFTWVDDEMYKIEQTGWGPSYGGDMYQRSLAGLNETQMTLEISKIPNIWSSTTRYNTPFDQPFHLILNVAVGSSNGFFEANKGGKPWVDGEKTAMKDFWAANSTWLPTWGDEEQHSMIVKSVKIWKEGKCGT